jgi:hypothetical protein
MSAPADTYRCPQCGVVNDAERRGCSDCGLAFARALALDIADLPDIPDVTLFDEDDR